MANEVTYSDLVSNGGAVAEVLSALVVEQLYDPTDLRSVCQRIDYSTFGSTQMAITKDATPSAFASTAEAVSVANSAYTTSEFTLSVSKYALAYELTDLVGVSGSPIDLDRIVRNLTAGVSLTMTDLICALFGSLSNSVGTSGVNLSVDDIYCTVPTEHFRYEWPIYSRFGTRTNERFQIVFALGNRCYSV